MSMSCGETENPLETMEQAGTANTNTLAGMKIPEVVPAAPQAPTGTPFVKEVGFYRNWKRTKPLTDTVNPGDTIYIQIVFSEGMKLVVADDKSARPILYYKVGGKLTRFRVAKFGATGSDFVSGDCKPINSQAVYLGKYTVKASDNGKFTVAVGKFNVDRQGNRMAAFYTHKKPLQITQPEPVVEPPEEVPPVHDTTPPTLLSIEYSTDSAGRMRIDEASEVPAGTDLYTKVVFSEPVTPAISYTTGGREKRYSLGQPLGVHWRGVCKPIAGTGNTTFLCYQTAWEEVFFTTVSTGTTDLAGNPLAEAVTAPEIVVTPQTVPQLQNPVAPTVTTVNEPQQPRNTAKEEKALHKAMTVAGNLEWKRAKILGVSRFPSGTGNEPRLQRWREELEKVGVTENLQKELWFICREEIPDQLTDTTTHSRWLTSVLVEFFRLKFLNPGKNEAELLRLFRQSAREGKVETEMKLSFFAFWNSGNPPDPYAYP